MPRVEAHDGSTGDSCIHLRFGPNVEPMSAWTRWLVGATSAVFVSGLVVALAPPGPLLTIDDIAYLAMGRTIAGEGGAPMPAQSPYGPLYPLLLAPGWLLGLEGDGMIAFARLVNALAGAATVPALASFLRRLFPEIDPRRVLVAALVGALLPAALLTASIVWTERLLSLLIVLVMVALFDALEAPSGRSALAATAAAVLLFAAHPRLGVSAVVVIAVSGWAVRGRGMAVMSAVVASGAVGLGCVEWFRRSLATATFDDPGIYGPLDLASRRGLGEGVQMLQLGLGALTYVVLAGTGLALWGIVVLARSRPKGWSVLAVGLGALVVAAWFLTGVPRADKWLHGRYVEVMAPMFVAVGVAQLHRLSRRGAALLLVGVPSLAGIVAAWNGPGDTWASARSPVMMLGVEVGGAPYGSDIFEPGAAAAVAIAVGLAAWALCRWRIEAAGLLLVGASLWGVHSGLETLRQLHEFTVSGEVDEGLDPSTDISELFVDVGGVSASLTNALVWEVGFDRSVTEQTPRTTHVLLAPDATPPLGATLVIEFRQGTLWELNRSVSGRRRPGSGEIPRSRLRHRHR